MDNKFKAKKLALEKIREALGQSSGKGLGEGMSAKVVAKDAEGLEEGLKAAAEMIEQAKEGKEEDYDSYSREDLIKMLKNK